MLIQQSFTGKTNEMQENTDVIGAQADKRAAGWLQAGPVLVDLSLLLGWLVVLLSSCYLFHSPLSRFSEVSRFLVVVIKWKKSTDVIGVQVDKRAAGRLAQSSWI